MVTNRSRPLGTIVPRLFYEDVARAIDWLCGAFGFTERLRYGPEGDPRGAELQYGDGAVTLSKARTGQSPDWADRTNFRQPRPGEITVTVSVHVEDVDAHFERARKFGAVIVHEPETYQFGERQYSAADYAGHRWGFSQSVADVDPLEWGAQLPGR
jgi:uncharacterized glyoxalase superfamily protein PhnB